MIVLNPRRLAVAAVAVNGSRPATATVHDSHDARLIVFRLAPGQSIPVHRNAATVILTVLGGRGIVVGENDDEQEVREGDVIVYAPNEAHGMRATSEKLVLLATIAPRPGSRATRRVETATVADRETT